MTFETKREKPKLKSNDTHPEAISKHNRGIVDEDLREFITDLNSKIDGIKEARQEWENRLTRWFKQRYGRRKAKNFPWPNASNIHIPTIDKAIKKMLPYYVMLLWAPKQIAQFEVMRGDSADEQIGQDRETGKPITLGDASTYNEHMLDYIVKDQMEQSLRKSVFWTSKMLMWGRSLVKVVYEYRTRIKEVSIDLDDIAEGGQLFIANNAHLFQDGNEEELSQLLQALVRDKNAELDLEDGDQVKQMRKAIEQFKSGKTKFNFFIKIQEAHAPKWVVCNPQDIIVPINVNNIQEAPIICHETYWSEVQLQEAAIDGRFDPDVVEKIIDNLNSSNETKEFRNDARGDGQTSLEATTEFHTGAFDYGDSNSMIRVREVCALGKDKKSGLYCKKVIITYSELYPEQPLKFVELPYDDGKWPYTDFVFESDRDDGWYSPRGIPEQLDYLATTVNVMHNQKIDRMTIGNAPMVAYLVGQVNPANARYIPGQFIPIKEKGSLEPIILPNRQESYVEEERQLNAYIENYLSSPDFGLTNINGPAAGARTATEIQNVSQQRNDVFELASKLYLENFSELLQMTWARHMQFGDENYRLYMPDEDNPVEWVRQYGLRNMSIRPRGTLQNSAPSVRFAESKEMMMVAQNPQFSPYLKLENILKEYFTTKDPDRVDEFLKEVELVTKQQEEAIQLQMDQQNKEREFQMMIKKAEQDFELAKIRAEGEQKIALEFAKAKVNRQTERKDAPKKKTKGKTQSAA